VLGICESSGRLLVAAARNYLAEHRKPDAKQIFMTGGSTYLPTFEGSHSA